jgi:acyl-CoA thioesterase-2
VHSLHAYFLRPGDPSIPIVYTVDRIRDGRSFTTRRVVGLQHGKAIFALTASFCLPEDGIEHSVPMPDVPDPESLPTLVERMAPYADERAGWWVRTRPIDLRYVGDPPRAAMDNPEPHTASNQVWMRTFDALPDDPLIHVCALTYASDMSLLDSVLLPHHLAFGTSPINLASLDHAMWFHRPFRADQWLLYDQQSPSAGFGRGLAEGRIFRADGALAVSVVQEGLVRRLR